MTVDKSILERALVTTLSESDLEHLGTKYRGKVRDNYSTKDGRRVIVVTDRISAFDRVIGTLPFKGQVLNHVAAFWFDETRHIAPNHVLSVPDPNVMVCRECDPIKVEVIVRAYLTGVSSTAILTAYQKGEREFCGHRLPEGLKPHQKLPQPIVTPTTKAPLGEHDENVSREQIIARGDVTADDFDRAAALGLKLFDHASKLCAQRGMILVDTKYEFGKTPDGEIVVIDEIHTPDSSRYWFANTYEQRMAEGKAPESFDKEYVRRWLADQGFRGDGPIPTLPDDVRIEAARRYIEACDAVSGRAFVPNLEVPAERMKRTLASI